MLSLIVHRWTFGPKPTNAFLYSQPLCIGLAWQKGVSRGAPQASDVGVHLTFCFYCIVLGIRPGNLLSYWLLKSAARFELISIYCAWLTRMWFTKLSYMIIKSGLNWIKWRLGAGFPKRHNKIKGHHMGVHCFYISGRNFVQPVETK